MTTLHQLETERLYLRKFEEADLDFVYTHFSSSDVSKYLYDNEPPRDIDGAKAILEWCTDFSSEHHVRWCIVSKESMEQMGTCGFHAYDKINNAAEIGYDLSSAYWSQGYMSEALTRMLSLGFAELNLHRVYAYVSVSNNRSNRLLEKLGFRHEGLIRDKHLFRGKYYDHNLYSLLRTEVDLQIADAG